MREEAPSPTGARIALSAMAAAAAVSLVDFDAPAQGGAGGGGGGAAAEAAPVPEADPKAAWRRARSLAHQLAAAGGYSQRAALWEGEVAGDGPAVVPVQLYAGNEYQFVVGFDAPGAGLGLAVFDARGRVLPGEVHRAAGKMVTKVRPAASGVHRVRVRLLDGAAAPAAAAMTYVYK